ncbi:hypothetical protein ABFS83_06G140700 [Erythranthe nasuta]
MVTHNNSSTQYFDIIVRFPRFETVGRNNCLLIKNLVTEGQNKRDAATAPNVGDQIPYAIIEGVDGKGDKDPIYVLENNLSLDQLLP